MLLLLERVFWDWLTPLIQRLKLCCQRFASKQLITVALVTKTQTTTFHTPNVKNSSNILQLMSQCEMKQQLVWHNAPFRVYRASTNRCRSECVETCFCTWLDQTIDKEWMPTLDLSTLKVFNCECFVIIQRLKLPPPTPRPSVFFFLRLVWDSWVCIYGLVQLFS